MSGYTKEWIWYTVYLSGTDEVLVIGTARDCAAFFNTTVNSFRSIVSKSEKIEGRDKYTFVTENLKTGEMRTYGAKNEGAYEKKWARAKELYLDGLNDAEIGEKINATACAVQNWRLRNKLPSNTARGRPKKERKE